MPPRSDPLPVATLGEKAGRLAASEMIKTASPETGGLKGVMYRLEAVGDILAQGHNHAGMPTAAVRAWRVGFQVGMGLEIGEHMQRMKMTASRSAP